MLVLQIATNLWWLRIHDKDFGVPTWLALAWIKEGFPHTEE